MGLVTVIVFIVMMAGLGALSLAPMRPRPISFMLLAMVFGFGISTFIILSLVLDLVGVPLDWRIFMLIALIGLGVFGWRYRHHMPRSFVFSEKMIFHLGALLITLGMLFVYTTGAFSYPHMENDDSWGHATSVKYVQTQKTFIEPDNAYLTAFSVGAFQYIDPYPPSYDVLLGVLSQVEGRIEWVLKFFNSLLIALSYLFFYCFAAHFFSDSKKGFLATLILAAVPAYLSHFIWAIALSLPLYFVSFFALEKMRKDHGWFVPAMIAVGASLIITPTHSVYFAIFLALYLLGNLVTERVMHLKIWAACIAGGMLTLIFYWISMFIRYKTFVGLARGIGFESLSGTGDRAYIFTDFIFARGQNMINAPIGFGLAVFLLAIIGVVLALREAPHLLKPTHRWMLIAIFWLVLTIYTVNSANMAIKLSPFRTWVLLAIPVALLAAHGWSFLMDVRGNKFWIVLSISFVVLLGYNQYAQSTNDRLGYAALPQTSIVIALIAVPLIFGLGYMGSMALKNTGLSMRRAALIVFLVGIFLIGVTSFMAKYELNTAKWYPGGTFYYDGTFDQNDYAGYLSLKDLPQDTRIFSLTYRHAATILGYDHFTCNYCQPDIVMRNMSGNVKLDALYPFLKDEKYQYVIVDHDYIVQNGQVNWQDKLKEMQASGKFVVAKQVQVVNDAPPWVLFRVA